MQAAETSFISSTFWTERIGPTAALATLEEMERLKSWEVITNQGTKMQNLWRGLACENNLSISVNGIPALSTYAFNSEGALKYKTFVTQEMLKKGFLASTLFYASVAHTDEHIKLYGEALNDIFGVIAKCEAGTLNIDVLLDGPVCHSGFKRLN